jgi:hypothetical protein
MMTFTFFTLTLDNFFESYFILQLNYIKGLVFSQIYTNTLILITLLDFQTISHTPNIISIGLIYLTPRVSHGTWPARAAARRAQRNRGAEGWR